MSATPESRPVKKPRPAGVSPRPSHAGKTSGFDLVIIAAGVVLLVAVGYVAYRTQVSGESLETVLPFLAPDRPAGATSPALAATAPRNKPVNRLVDAPAPIVRGPAPDKPVGSDFVGDDSPFADPSKKKPAPATPATVKPEELPTGAEGLFGRRYVPTEPKTKEPEVELGEETAFGRKIIRKDPNAEPKK